ncbi:hypothetical protein RHGRI_024695 [Rhododendron griersonianum]|uniref:Uncharacterized protein n=1 Tax=Rhododendron griersonianum TaxID=479676 RepID=A0AAV6JBV9_9ERIC|nr:hypothetical protein RHGRI_024695 [Rhododendron griersonianum]
MSSIFMPLSSDFVARIRVKETENETSGSRDREEKATSGKSPINMYSSACCWESTHIWLNFFEITSSHHDSLFWFNGINQNPHHAWLFHFDRILGGIGEDGAWRNYSC